MSKKYQHVTFTVVSKPLGMRVYAGSLKVDAVKGPAVVMGIEVGDELVKINDVIVTPKNWKDYYTAARCPFRITMLRDKKKKKEEEENAAKQQSPPIVVEATEAKEGMEGGDQMVVVSPCCDNEVDDSTDNGGGGGRGKRKTTGARSIDNINGLSDSRYGVVVRIVSKKPYGFSIVPGTVRVKEVKGQAKIDGVVEGDELISIAGVPAEPTTWRELFKSARVPFPIAYIVEDPIAKQQELQSLIDELDGEVTVGIGLGNNDFQPLLKQQQQQQQQQSGANLSSFLPFSSLLKNNDDPLLSLLREGWGTIKDAKALFHDLASPFINSSSSSSSSPTKGSTKKGRASITDLIQKLTDSISSMHVKANSTMAAVDNILASSLHHLEQKPGGGGGEQQQQQQQEQLGVLSVTQTELKTQLQNLNRVFLKSVLVRRTLLEVKNTMISSMMATTSSKDGDSVKKLLAESVTALEERTTSLATQLHSMGKEASPSSSFSLLPQAAKGARVMISENKSLIEGGISLLSFAGVVKPQQAVMVQRAMSVTIDALESKNKLISLVFDSLLARLPYLKIPDIEGNSSDNAYWFKVGNIDLSGLKVSRDQIQTYMHGTTMRIKARNLCVTMKEVSWAFRQLQWPILKAQGKADCDASHLNLTIVLKLRRSTNNNRKGGGGFSWKDSDNNGDDEGRWEFYVVRKLVSIEKLKMKITSSSVSWVANTILWLFNESLRKYVQSEIERTINDKLTGMISVLNKLIKAQTVQKVLTAAGGGFQHEDGSRLYLTAVKQKMRLLQMYDVRLRNTSSIFVEMQVVIFGLWAIIMPILLDCMICLGVLALAAATVVQQVMRKKYTHDEIEFFGHSSLLCTCINI
eukprot:jgi/Bigna1/85919/estExt_fgenesh1_pg.C_70022